MKKTMTFCLIAFLVILTGCASKPSSIKASYVPISAYEDHDCDQLMSEAIHINRRLAELHDSLKGKANTDAIQMGVGLVLFWPALFFLEGGDGPEASEYSRLQGEYQAIRSAARRNQCPFDGLKTPEEFMKEAEQDSSDT